MIRLRFAVLAILASAAFAGRLTYFVVPLAQLETDHRLQASVPRTEPVVAAVDRHSTAEQQAAAAFERAAKTILERSPDALAYAGPDEPPITGRIPSQSGAQSRGDSTKSG
jgi:hypothetical protein